MTVDRIIEDQEFGHLYIKSNARSVNYSYRPAKDGTAQCGILITVPRGFVLANVLESVERMRPKLRKMLDEYRALTPTSSNNPSRHIDWDFRIITDCIHISLVQGNRQGYYLHNEEGEFRRNATTHDVEVIRPAILQLVCPKDCDFQDEKRQQWLEKAIMEGIRSHAKAQLLPRLKDYARLYNIQLHETKINSSKGRWGSCAEHIKRGIFSKTRYFNINLSLFTLLLPIRLQKLIILHELTHTHHMNHSEAFHHDLDIWLNGEESALEQELKRYTTSIFSFV